MAKQYSLEIGGQRIEPGSRTTVDVPVARLYDHTDTPLPVHVIHGRQSGARLFVSAVIHGDELNGIEIIRRLLNLKAINRLRGTLIAVPVVNTFGFINQTRYLPDRRDLNRFFPGQVSGSLASQLAETFMREVVAHCTHGIDLHTGSNHRYNLPQIRGSFEEDSELLGLAKSFGAPVIVNSRIREGSLRQAAADMETPVLVYEAGEALRFDEYAIRIGVRGILAVMRQLEMLPKQKKTRRPQPLLAQETYWARAPLSGIFNSTRRTGDIVSTGDSLGTISDPFGSETQHLRTRAEGMIIGRTMLPLVYKGDAIYHIACFEKHPRSDLDIETFAHEYDPEVTT